MQQFWVLAVGLMLSFCLPALPQGSSDDIAQRAVQEFRKEDFPAAERDFRQVVKANPTNIIAEFYLGQTLFREERYADAAVFFQKARGTSKKPANNSPRFRIGCSLTNSLCHMGLAVT